jgi:hypothetical protein
MRIFLIFSLAFFVSNLLSQEPPPPETSTKAVPDAGSSGENPYIDRVEKQFPFYPGGKMTIRSAVPGDIRIVGWKKGVVRIEADKTVRGLTPEKARLLLEQLPIRVRYNQTSAVVEIGKAPAKASKKASAAAEAAASAEDAAIRCDLTIYVPGDRIDLNAAFLRGDLAIESVNGWIEVSLGRGDLRASAMSGYFSGMTEQGNIVVEMDGTRWSGQGFDAVTKMGSIDLRLPTEYSAALQLETLDGKVVADYPERIVDGEPEPWQIGTRRKAQALQAPAGDGGAPVKLITSAGDIRLSLKP